MSVHVRVFVRKTKPLKNALYMPAYIHTHTYTPSRSSQAAILRICMYACIHITYINVCARVCTHAYNIHTFRRSSRSSPAASIRKAA